MSNGLKLMLAALAVAGALFVYFVYYRQPSTAEELNAVLGQGKPVSGVILRGKVSGIGVSPKQYLVPGSTDPVTPMRLNLDDGTGSVEILYLGSAQGSGVMTEGSYVIATVEIKRIKMGQGDSFVEIVYATNLQPEE